MNEFFSQSLGISLSLISFQNDITLSVYNVSQIDPINVMLPFGKEMFHPVLSDVHECSLQEPLLEIFILTSIFQTIECTLLSSL